MDITDQDPGLASGSELEELTRTLLRIAGEVTGLDSTYLTRIDWAADQQEILFSRNTGSIAIDEGLRVAWSDTLCRRALEEGVNCTVDVPSDWGDSQAARDLGLETYVSFPVHSPDGEIYGTFCGASGSRADLDEVQINLLQVCARTVTDQLMREEQLRREQTRATQAEDRLKARAEFLATAEHQLKTPLTVILGMSSVLESSWESIEDERRLGFVETISKQANTLTAQLNRMLEQARTEVLVTELNIRPLDAREEIGSATDAFAGASRRHTVRLDWNAGDTKVCADAHALYQVLGHLIENAIKHSPEGDIVITARTERARLIISVQDSGHGLPVDVDVFAPFSRGGSSQGTNGIGLGLHIVRSLVESMDGTVSAENAAAGGAIFTISLPLA